MSDAHPHRRVVRVTTTTDYLIDENDERRAVVLREWFEDPRYPLGGHHAYREGSEIGNSRKLVSYRVMTMEEFEREVTARQKARNAKPVQGVGLESDCPKARPKDKGKHNWRTAMGDPTTCDNCDQWWDGIYPKENATTK